MCTHTNTVYYAVTLPDPLRQLCISVWLMRVISPKQQNDHFGGERHTDPPSSPVFPLLFFFLAYKKRKGKKRDIWYYISRSVWNVPVEINSSHTQKEKKKGNHFMDQSTDALMMIPMQTLLIKDIGIKLPLCQLELEVWGLHLFFPWLPQGSNIIHMPLWISFTVRTGLSHSEFIVSVYYCAPWDTLRRE